MMPYLISNPRYVREDNSIIEVEWDHPTLGPIPYSVLDGFGELEMQQIWDNLMAGEYGEIAPYSPPETE